MALIVAGVLKAFDLPSLNQWFAIYFGASEATFRALSFGVVVFEIVAGLVIAVLPVRSRLFAGIIFTGLVLFHIALIASPIPVCPCLGPWTAHFRAFPVVVAVTGMISTVTLIIIHSSGWSEPHPSEDL